MIFSSHYINTVINETYVELPSAKKFPDDLRKDILRHAVLCENLTKLGATYSAFTVRTADSLLFVAVKSARKHAKSLCFYTEAIGGGMEKADCTPDGYLRLLDTKFYSEDALDAAGMDAVEKYETAAADSPAALHKEVVVSKDAAKAVLYAAMHRWVRNDSAISIAVPASECTDEASYSAYCFAAMKKLYSYFPAALRAEAGFCTYLPESKANAYPEFYICFIPANEASAKAIFLDGSTDAKCKTLVDRMNASSAMKRVLNHIMDCSSDEEREAFINELFTDVEGNGAVETFRQVQPSSYNQYGYGLAVLDSSETDMMKLIPLWEDFLKRNRMPKGLTEKVGRHIDAVLDESELDTYIKSKPAAERFDHIINLAPVAQISPKTQSVLWRNAVENIEQNSENAAKRFETVSKADIYSRLSIISKKDTEELKVRYGKEAADERIEIGASKLQSEQSKYRSIEDADRANILDNSLIALNKLSNALRVYAEPSYYTAKINTVAKQVFEEYFMGLVEKELKTDSYGQTDRPNELKQLIEKRKHILGLVIDGTRKYQEFVPGYSTDSVQKFIESQIAELNETINSQDNIVVGILDEYDGENLFDIIEVSNASADRLDKDHQDKLVSAIIAKTGRFTYTGFAQRYGTELNAQSVSQRGIIGAPVISELARNNFPNPVKLTARPRKELAKEITRQVERASSFGVDTRKLTFSVAGVVLPADALVRLLNLDYSDFSNDRTSIERSSAEAAKLVEQFFNAGIYSGVDFPDIRNSFELHGLRQIQLIGLASSGRINVSDEILQIFLAGAVESVSIKNNTSIYRSADMIGKAVEKIGTPSMQFQTLFESIRLRNAPPRPKKTKRSPVPIILLSLTTVAFLGAAVFFFLQLRTANNDITDKTAQIEQCQNDISQRDATIAGLETTVANNEQELIEIGNNNYKSTIDTVLACIDAYDAAPETADHDENGVSTGSRYDAVARLDYFLARLVDSESGDYLSLSDTNIVYDRSYDNGDGTYGSVIIRDINGSLVGLYRGFDETYGDYVSVYVGNYANGARDGSGREFVYYSGLTTAVKTVVFEGNYTSDLKDGDFTVYFSVDDITGIMPVVPVPLTAEEMTAEETGNTETEETVEDAVTAGVVEAAEAEGSAEMPADGTEAAVPDMITYYGYLYGRATVTYAQGVPTADEVSFDLIDNDYTVTVYTEGQEEPAQVRAAYIVGKGSIVLTKEGPETVEGSETVEQSEMADETAVPGADGETPADDSAMTGEDGQPVTD